MGTTYYTLDTWRKRIAELRSLTDVLQQNVNQVLSLESIAVGAGPNQGSLSWPIDDSANEYAPAVKDTLAKLSAMCDGQGVKSDGSRWYGYYITPRRPSTFLNVTFSPGTTITANDGTPFSKCLVNDLVRVQAQLFDGAVPPVMHTVDQQTLFVATAGTNSITLSGPLLDGNGDPVPTGVLCTTFSLTLVEGDYP